MLMTKNNSEAPIQNSFWSACLMLVTVFAIADVLTGGLVRESVLMSANEYVLAMSLVIVTVGVYASDGSPGYRFARSYSRHKL